MIILDFSSPRVICGTITLAVILCMFLVDYFQLAFSKFNFIDFDKRRTAREPVPNYVLFGFVILWHIPFGIEFWMSQIVLLNVITPSAYSMFFVVLAYCFLDSRQKYKSLKIVMYTYAIVALVLQTIII